MHSITPPCVFTGVFPRDRIPTITQFPCCFILNSDSSNQPGSHWLAIYLPNDCCLEFFDSYALPPSFYGFSFTSTISNNKLLQSNSSNVCGQYCIFYLIQRSRGYSMRDIQNMFCLDSNWNDMRVANFVQKYFQHPKNAPITSSSCIQSCCARFYSLR